VKNLALLSSVVPVTLAFLALAVACGSSSDNATDGGASDAHASDAKGDAIIDPMNCVPPGTPSNSQGIGGYCSPMGGQCTMAGPGGSATLCSADFQAPAHAWFCTFPCTSSSTCGPGATCVNSSMGEGCVPASCLYLEGDGGGGDAAGDGGGGGDGASDAPGDSAGDASGD
jgi:hypothetical protein